MNIAPSEAKQLTLAEYEGLMFHWNKAHGGEDEQGELEPPTPEEIAERRKRLEARGIRTLY